MNYITITFIAFALAIDAFSVAIGCAAFLGKFSIRQKFRLSFHFGLFQFAMPILGWYAGSKIVKYIEQYDHWIALIILSVIGLKMIYDSNITESKKCIKDYTKGISLISLSIATSIDALAVGFSVGVIQEDIIMPAIVIGIVACAMTLLGIKLGTVLSSRFGHRVSIFGGIILIIIGINIVLDHLNII